MDVLEGVLASHGSCVRSRSAEVTNYRRMGLLIRQNAKWVDGYDLRSPCGACSDPDPINRSVMIHRSTTHEDLIGRDHANGFSHEMNGMSNAPGRTMGRCSKVIMYTGTYSSYGERDLGPTGEIWRHATTMPSICRDVVLNVERPVPFRQPFPFRRGYAL